MNRDYSQCNLPPEPVRTYVAPETPHVVDYLQPLCGLCFRTGNVRPREIDGLITYAHEHCVRRWLEGPDPMC